MNRSTVFAIFLMIGMSMAPMTSGLDAPNDAETENGVTRHLSVDGYVNTKFASVGSDVELMALTRGHSDATLVTADIMTYEGFEPMQLLAEGGLPTEGTFVDKVVLTRDGPHEDDADTMVWSGRYIVPVNALGGVYGATIIAEDGNLRASDDPTQVSKLVRDKLEGLMDSAADTWAVINPLDDIKSDFADVDSVVDQNGGWNQFAVVASEGSGTGGSAELWDSMIDAGYNHYEMEAGAAFLEAMMNVSKSDDMEACFTIIAAFLTYGDEFPVPREMTDLDEVVDYLMAFDPGENFTRLEQTDDFRVAWEEMMASDELDEIMTAMDDLANNRRVFQAIQTILHNTAMLAVLDNTEDLAMALQAWFEPLIDEDVDSMTPAQRFVVAFFEMGEPDFVDVNDDGTPESITFEYEKLLETSEGQAWSSKMETSAPWINDALEEFNNLPEDLFSEVIDAFTSPKIEEFIEDVQELEDWFQNASGHRRHYFWPSWDDDEDGDDFEDEEGREKGGDNVEFDFHEISTSAFDSHLLDLGVELKFWGPEERSEYPESFAFSMESNHGEEITTSLVQESVDSNTYVGRLTATNIRDAVWTFSQPMKYYQGEVDNAEIELEYLRPSMLEMMQPESMDEIFIISAVGVVVDQDEIGSVDSDFTIKTLSYDATGPVGGAEVDIASIRVSPQAADFEEMFEPEGDVILDISSTEFKGRYTGADLDGDVSVVISSLSDDDEEGESHDKAAAIDDVEVQGNGGLWDAFDSLPTDTTGLVNVNTMGKTSSGLDFTHVQHAPLPGTSGCAETSASSYDTTATISWKLRQYEGDFGYYESPDLTELTIDWGDGSEVSDYSDSGDTEESWESHEYGEDNHGEEYTITVSYSDAAANVQQHQFEYKAGVGFKDDRYGDEYYSGWMGAGGGCYLDSWLEADPSPSIVEQMISKGPLEVMDEQVVSSDTNGEAHLQITPSMSGIYITIVQSKLVKDGKTLTGVGMNFAGITSGSVEVGGLELETHFAGLPVYSIDAGDSGLATISVTPSGINSEEYMAMVGVAPLELDIPFPSIDPSTWSGEEEYEIEFESGDTTRSQEIRTKAPISLMVVAIMDDDEEMFPQAMFAAIVLNNPADLDMTGTLGPGQVTNIALAEGEATRMLAMGAPQEGFDPASIDFSSITELIWGEGVRNEMGWIAAEERAVESCTNMDAEIHEWDDDYNLAITLRHDVSWYSDPETEFDPSDAVLVDEDGNTITPYEAFSTVAWDSERWEAKYQIEVDEGAVYTLRGDGIPGTPVWEMTVTMDDDDDPESSEVRYYLSYDSRRCSGDRDLSDEEEFAMFDDFFGSLESVAWGLGSSADLNLPILSSPSDEYTILAVAQQGEGDSATITAAYGTQVSVPNPEPPEIGDLTLAFNPIDPKAGDMVLVSVFDENGLPVSGLSVTVMKNRVTMFSIISDSEGQATFEMPTGDLVVRVSGGMFEPVEMKVSVTDSGMSIDEIDGMDEDDLTTIGCEGTTLFEKLDCETDDDDDDSKSDSKEKEADGGFLPAPGMALTFMMLIGAALLLRRSKDD